MGSPEKKMQVRVLNMNTKSKRKIEVLIDKILMNFLWLFIISSISLLLFLGLFYFPESERMRMDEFCQEQFGTKMSSSNQEISNLFQHSIKFKCNGNNKIYSIFVTEVVYDEWGNYKNVKHIKPHGSVLKSLVERYI